MCVPALCRVLNMIPFSCCESPYRRHSPDTDTDRTSRAGRFRKRATRHRKEREEPYRLAETLFACPLPVSRTATDRTLGQRAHGHFRRRGPAGRKYPRWFRNFWSEPGHESSADRKSLSSSTDWPKRFSACRPPFLREKSLKVKSVPHRATPPSLSTPRAFADERDNGGSLDRERVFWRPRCQKVELDHLYRLAEPDLARHALVFS